MCSSVANLKENSSKIALDDDEELSISPPRDQSVNGDSGSDRRISLNYTRSNASSPVINGFDSPSNHERKTSLSCCVDYRAVWLDDDVLPEILARLPTKSVTRFKTVCKSWYSLISSKQFCRLHTLHCHKPLPSLILLTTRINGFKQRVFYSNPITKTSKSLRIIPYQIDFIQDFKILSCSNGLMLLQDIHFNENYVYNPTTKQSKKLGFASNDKFTRVASSHLVFDPSKSPHYKIIIVRSNESRRNYPRIIEVFDSESGTWRAGVEPFTLAFGIISACVECKNLIYLLGYDCIYFFDISKTVSQLIACRLPEGATTPSNSRPIQEFNGSIYYSALVVDDPDTLRTRVCLWQLQVNEDDLRGPKWLLKYQLEPHPLPGLFKSKLTFVMETSTLFVHVCRKSGKSRIPGKIVAYNFLDRSDKELGYFEPRISRVMINQFGETLALL